MFANSASVGLAYVDARLQPAVFCTSARISAILTASRVTKTIKLTKHPIYGTKQG